MDQFAIWWRDIVQQALPGMAAVIVFLLFINGKNIEKMSLEVSATRRLLADALYKEQSADYSELKRISDLLEIIVKRDSTGIRAG